MKIKNINLAIGVLACSALLGIGLFSNPTYASDTLDPDANHDAAMQVVNAYESTLQTYFETNYPDVSVSFNKATTSWGPYYMPDFTDHAYVRLMWGYSLETQYGATSTDLPDDPSADMISDFLVDKGFQKYIDEVGTYPITTEYLNSTTGVICSFINGSSLEGIFCSHISELQISEDWQNFIDAIGAAYYTKENALPFINYANEAYTSNPDIKNSDYSPYQYTEVPMANYVGLFYRQSPTSNWEYFTGTQASLECSEFTGEAQKGFAGYICYNGSEESRVTVVEEESGITTPDTGVFTKDNKALVALSSIGVITAFGTLVYLSCYITKRVKSHVHFGKK